MALRAECCRMNRYMTHGLSEEYAQGHMSHVHSHVWTFWLVSSCTLIQVYHSLCAQAQDVRIVRVADPSGCWLFQLMQGTECVRPTLKYDVQQLPHCQ